MSEDRSQISPSRRDRAVRRVRNLTWAVAAGSAGLATTLSVVAAHAFKGHARSSGASPAAAPKHKAPHRVVVPGPQHVPSIAPLTPPAAPPSTTPTPSPTPAPAPATHTPAPATPAPAPAPAPQPQTSGGS
jgi:hypothetical protein